jgi:hypothetical protein
MNLKNYLDSDPFAEAKNKSFGDAYEAHLHAQDAQEYQSRPDPRIQEGKDTAALSVYFIKHLVIIGFKFVFYGLSILFVLFLIFAIFT